VNARRRSSWVPAVALAALAASSSVALEPVLFEEAASGILELADYSRLRVEGFAGTVSVRAGKPGELRYSAATRATKREARPVALWLRGSTIIFRPVAGLEAEVLILEIAVSEGVQLEIEKKGGKVQVSGVSEDVSVDSVDAEVDIRGVPGRVSATLEGGRLRLESLGPQAIVSGTGLEAVDLVRVMGGVRLTLSESSVRAETVGPMELDLDRTTFDLTGSTGGISGTVSEGRLKLADVRGGGSLVLEETPLDLADSRGAYEIDTDSDLNFRSLAGSLNVRSFGGAVTGDGHAGEVTIGNRDANVFLKNIGGPIVINGDTLKITLAETRNTVHAELIGSEVMAEGLKGALEIRNEFGDISVKGIEGPAKITNRNGNVHVLDLTGTAEIDAEGPEVRVGWRSIGREGDSRIANTGGDLYVNFPVSQGARIEAQADNIESDLEELRIAADGRHANGLLENAKSPTVTLSASGRLVVSKGR